MGLLKRSPEPKLVMSDKDSVTAYDKQGLLGALRAVYLLGADIISAIFPRSGKCLDIGCGSGQFTLEYAKRIPLLEVLAFDLSAAAINLANKNLKKGTVTIDTLEKRIKFEIKDMRELDQFKSNSFDAIVCSYTLHHCKTASEALYILKQIKRILKDRGALYIYDLVRPKTIEEFEYIKKNLLVKLPSTFRQDTINSIQAAFSDKELKHIIQQSQFKDLKYFVTQRGALLFKTYNGRRAKYKSSKSLKEYPNYSRLVKERYELAIRMFREAGLVIENLVW